MEWFEFDPLETSALVELRHAVLLHNLSVRLVTQSRPFGNRNGAVRVEIDSAMPKTCGAVHIESQLHTKIR